MIFIGVSDLIPKGEHLVLLMVFISDSALRSDGQFIIGLTERKTVKTGRKEQRTAIHSAHCAAHIRVAF